ncbi:hypothetical protein A4A49_56128 [Nicotiana attenuata]|uniref:Uncharacterized protein n=1 Tax=Nicotiana attenuata TaxID=49451 RepID=A0A314LIM1_NICAT|nr:hypothetical protein A4A49_56128 [Nicotiana attenuata]
MEEPRGNKSIKNMHENCELKLKSVERMKEDKVKMCVYAPFLRSYTAEELNMKFWRAYEISYAASRSYAN